MNWRDLLQPVQRSQVELSSLYMTRFAHGAPGHLNYSTIASMAILLDAFANEDPPRLGTVLPVPYHSQHEADATLRRKDCGPACVEMVGEYLKPEIDATTDDIMAWITGGPDRSVWISEVQDAAQHFYGVALERHDGADWLDLKNWVMADRTPIIVLVHYGSFGTRLDRGYTAGHYMLVCGFDQVYYQDQVVERVVMHDPDFYGEMMAQGAFISVVREHFMGMWDDCFKDGNPRRLALVPRLETT